MTEAIDEKPLQSEDKERVNRLAREIIAPGIRQAVEAAESEAPINEVLSALVNAYGAVLIHMVGRDATVALMHSYAEHLVEVGESTQADAN